MIWTYGKKSRSKLDTCHSDIVLVAELGLKRSPYDITIIHGWRGETLQNALFESGASKTPWPNSKHNVMRDDKPKSDAFDFGPWVNGMVPWKETHIFAAVAGVFYAAAAELGIEIIWGGDWDRDGLSSDQTLLDWGHMHRVT